eukprot:3010723-Alexandrium_andersonii.AAC.1
MAAGRDAVVGEGWVPADFNFAGHRALDSQVTNTEGEFDLTAQFCSPCDSDVAELRDRMMAAPRSGSSR